MRNFVDACARALTSRRGARISLAIGVLVLVGLMGALGRISLTTESEASPAGSESAKVAALADEFPSSDTQTLLIVASRAGDAPLTASDTSALADLGTQITESLPDATTFGPLTSDDELAAMIQLSAPSADDKDSLRALVESVRATVADHPIDDLTVQVTGGAAFGVDVAKSFDGADFTLLLVTILIVAVLLIATYRSPVLWLIPLAVVGFADQIANKATAGLGNIMGLHFDTGIVSVLVFGAGTNYALLLVSRYRERLLIDDDHRVALRTAWKATLGAIVASNITVVLSLLTLVLAIIPGTRGLGVACAVGLVIALLAVLFVLPPALAVCGRRIFWPFIPKPGSAPVQGRVWGKLARSVTSKPVLPLVGGLTLLTVMAAGLFSTSVGLSQTEKFRVPSESGIGLEVLSEHFDAGAAQPFVVISRADSATEVSEAASQVSGVVRVSPPQPSIDGSMATFIVTPDSAPGTAENRDAVLAVRDAVHAVPGADALVGGQSAMDVDNRDANLHDFLLIAPLVLLVTLIVLIVLLRALVAPVVLLLVNAFSAIAAMGAGAWLGKVLFGWDALDLQVPLLSFLFLVALGVDYTIFLVHRARAEAAHGGTRAGIVTALATTGGVITSAGVVLAGVFAALGLLPLVTLGQIGLTVGVGVLVDTLVVRTCVVPALFALVGDRMWWPSSARRGGEHAEPATESDHVSDVALSSVH